MANSGKKLKTNKKPKGTGKPWYTRECITLKKRLKNLAKLFTKNPKDPYLRGKYFVAKKDYRRAIKRNKRTFEIDNLNSLKNLKSDPKKFWNLLKRINNSKGQPIGNQISPDVWIKHFSAINSKDPALNPVNLDYCNSVESEVNSLLNQDKDGCAILDREFTIQEVVSGIKRLKKGKATAFDAVTNDVIRASMETISPTLVNIFNKLAPLLHFPKQWVSGLIVTIFKKDEKDDPNNYRGITLNNYF